MNGCRRRPERPPQAGGLPRFRREVFDMLELVRVYTKPPGKKFERTLPFVLRRGQTVIDAARLVHKDFAEGPGMPGPYKTQGIMVERSHLVEDGDILELHI